MHPFSRTAPLRTWLLIVGFPAMLCTFPDVQAQEPKFVQLTQKATDYEGKIVARSAESVWLMQRDGWLRRLKISDITGFRSLSDQFTPYSAAELRDRLRREFRDLEVVGTGSYLVVGPPAVVRDYAQVFEDQYRALRSYFSVRGFDLPQPEFPLIAIVFPDPASFAKHAESHGLRVPRGLRGYYVPSSNRISLFHSQPVAATRNDTSPHLSRNLSELQWAASEHRMPKSSWTILRDPWRESLTPNANSLSFAQSPLPWASTDGDLESTMVHEATHQVAFNVGIHNRLGNANPRWLVEGLATAFEAPGMRSTTMQKVPGAKLNQSRLSHFRQFVKQRRQSKSLESFIRNGNLSGMDAMDGYAQSWALTYFLIETRPREYAQYLKLIMARSITEECTDEDRIADFREAFGMDLVLLEAKFLRFIEQGK